MQEIRAPTEPTATGWRTSRSAPPADAGERRRRPETAGRAHERDGERGRTQRTLEDEGLQGHFILTPFAALLFGAGLARVSIGAGAPRAAPVAHLFAASIRQHHSASGYGFLGACPARVPVSEAALSLETEGCRRRAKLLTAVAPILTHRPPRPCSPPMHR